jgi:hypothetical protein
MVVIFFSAPLETSMVQISSSPSRAEMKANFSPSGDQRGLDEECSSFVN